MAGAAMEDGCIVEEWLRSLNLTHYTQAFLDNGYDDLEVCKQIGDEDLDAIGVEDAIHRSCILNAVKILQEKGGTVVYFTLDPDYQAYLDALSPGYNSDHDDSKNKDNKDSTSEAGAAAGLPGPADVYTEGKATLVTYPRLQLTAILRDLLAEDNQDPKNLVDKQGVENVALLEELARRYAADLKTHFHHVLDTLLNLATRPESPDSEKVFLESGSPLHYGTMFSVCGASRSVPPPLPSCPPPSNSYASIGTLTSCGKSATSSPSHRSHSSSLSIDESPEICEDGKKKGSGGIGRFFKNVGIRRSGRKYAYKKHDGDLNASEISMPDDERIELMIRVKEGKISMHDAIERVKRYERERGGSPTTGRQSRSHSECSSSCPASPASVTSVHSSPASFIINPAAATPPPSRGDRAPPPLPPDRQHSCPPALNRNPYPGILPPPPTTPNFARRACGDPPLLPRPPIKRSKSPFTFFKLPSFRGKGKSSCSSSSSSSSSSASSTMSPAKSSKSSSSSPAGTLPRCRIPTSLSHGDYCEPPVELSPDEDHPSPFPFPRHRAQGGGHCFTLAKPPSDHSGMYIYSDPASRTRTNPEAFHWISPMQLRKYFRSDSAPQERRGLFSSPFVKRKTLDDYATVIPFEDRQLTKQIPPLPPGSRDRRQFFQRNDSHNSISSTSSTADSQGHSRQGSVKSVKLETVAVSGNIVESPVDVHQVDNNDDGTLTKDKPSANMEAVANCFDDILKNCDEETMERKCNCSKDGESSSVSPNVANENEINNHKKHNTNNCENCGYSGNCGKEDNNRNSIHSNGDAVARFSRASTGSGGSLQSPDDKTLTKDGQQHVVDNNDTTKDVPTKVNGETPKIESFMLNKTVESELKCEHPACDSPDLGVDDTSPTGTLDSTASEDFKDSKYGSSSTMSVGSDASPGMERRNQQKTKLKLNKPQHMVRTAQNSAGEDCFSSDYEEDIAQKSDGSSSGGTTVCTCKSPVTAKRSSCIRVSSSTHSTPDHSSNSYTDSPRKNKTGKRTAKRPKPKTVEELLDRLGLQHLGQTFILHDLTSLELFSELEEEDLDSFGISSPEDRAKIITAAQLLLDYEASLETTGSDRAPSVASNQSSSSTSQSSAMTPNNCSENGEKFTVEDKEVISITNGHDYANIDIIGKSAIQNHMNDKYNGDQFHDDSDHLVLKVDTSSENGLCISMVGNKPETQTVQNGKQDSIAGTSSSSSQQKVAVHNKSPGKSKARPMIPIRTVSLPGESDGQNGPVMSTFKPQVARLGKVSTVRDKV